MPSAAGISSDVSVALSRGTTQRPQPFAPQPDAQPFAALLDAATPATPDGSGGAGVPAAVAPANQQTPPADNGASPQGANSAPAAPANTGASASATSGGSGAPDTSALPRWMRAQSTSMSMPSPSADNATLGTGATPNGTPVQNANAKGTPKGTAGSQNLASRGSGTADANGTTKTVPAPAPTGAGNATNPANDANASSSSPASPTNAAATSTNAAATPDSAANGDGPDAAAAAVLSAATSAIGIAAADSGTPGASKSPSSKDGQSNGAANAASDSSTASQAQLLPPDAAQPVAVALINNVSADAAPPLAKTGPAIADAAKVRTKAMPAAAPADQNAPTQDAGTDPASSASATDSSAAADSGGADDSGSAALDTTTGNNSASTSSAQQTPDQPQAPGAATLLSQIDFASSSSADRLDQRAGATASLNSAGVSATPAASANTTVAPNFGVFAANAMATNGTAPSAAGTDTAVPLAGLAVAIAGRAQAGSSQFDIRLDPPELGRIDVRLGVDGSGQVTTHVTVDRPDTLQLLQSQQPQLQQALEQAGLKTADNGLQFTLRDQSFAGQNGGSGGQQQAAPPTQLVIPEPETAPIDTAQIYARLRLGNGLDIRV